MALKKILVVDDEELICNFLQTTISYKNISADTASSGKEALALLKKNIYDLVITDMKMADISGLDILKKTKELSPQTLVLIMTAFGSIENAVEAMRLGAFNYVLKPFTPDTIETLIVKAEEHLSLIRENGYLREQVSGQAQIIAASQSMKKILKEVCSISKSHSNVLIYGESGTGKEVIASTIHKHSLRANKPYIRVNCAAIPDTLIESEFFGHEKGAFTGANSRRLGRFELADGGTLLLDEITEIPVHLQPKLLRVIQEKEFERVGGSTSIKSDVRIISTSNRNLKEALETKLFRDDLYYRLNVIPIHVPALRERREDIIPLANYFLERFCYVNNKKKKNLSKSAEEKLLSYHWPGNIRELSNVVERIIVLDLGQMVESDHILID